VAVNLTRPTAAAAEGGNLQPQPRARYALPGLAARITRPQAVWQQGGYQRAVEAAVREGWLRNAAADAGSGAHPPGTVGVGHFVGGPVEADRPLALLDLMLPGQPPGGGLCAATAAAAPGGGGGGGGGGDGDGGDDDDEGAGDGNSAGGGARGRAATATAAQVSERVSQRASERVTTGGACERR
jgi:PI-3-kinase-related kinase SMG-1